MGEILKNKKGITLIALVVTIIVLLILAGVSIATLTGDNGILTQAGNAKEQTEIAEKKEIIELAAIQAMQKDRFGKITKAGLESILKGKFGGEDAKITDMGDGTFIVICPSGRVYLVDSNGNVTYLGKEEELLGKVEITANKESDTTPRSAHQVEVSLKTYVPIEDIELAYAWSTSKEERTTEYTGAKFEETSTLTNRKAIVSSGSREQGDYYLWIKVVINGKETEKIFGEYAIKEDTTLVACTNETQSTSTFLGIPIQRNLIKSVKIQTDLEGHSKDDGTCYDVSTSGNGTILAWYTEEVIDDIKYYNVTIAERGGVVANTDSSNLFRNIGYGLPVEATITGLENLDTSSVTNMSNMFCNCNSLKNLDVSSFNTSNVTNMDYMFYVCSNLISLDVSKFNTSNVTTMNTMFAACNNLTSINVSQFDTKNVTNMANMFNLCKKLTSLDVSNFDTSKVRNMYLMFSGCSSLTSLDVSKFNTSNVTNMGYLFNGCSSLTQLDVSGFKTSNVTNMNNIFNGCSNLTSIDVSGFNTSNVTSMGLMFSGCSNLTSIDVSKFDTSNVKIMTRMFNGCSKLTSLDVSNFDTSNVTAMDYMFSGSTGLTSLDLSNFNTGKTTKMIQMFYNCSNLINLDISQFDVTNVTDYMYMLTSVPSSIIIKTNSSTAEWIKTNFTNIKDDNIELVSENAGRKASNG